MAQAKQDMGTGSIKKLMLQLMIPAVVAQVVNLLYNIVDRIYIGHIAGIGAAALTGVGLFTPILMLLNAFAMLVGAGGAPRTAIALGQGDKKQAEKIISNSFTMLLLFSVVLTIGFYAGAPVLLRLFGASDVTLPYALSYSRIYIAGSVFVLVVLGMNPFINAQGFANIGMMTVSIGAVCNLILDPICIFEMKMGVQGAAMATVMSQFAAACWTLRFLTGKKATIRLDKNYLKLKTDRVKKILVLGLSGFTMSVTNSLVQMVCNINLAMYGGDMYIAAMTIINSVREVIHMPVSGVGNGAQPVMSFNYGAKEYGRVKQTIRYTAVILLVYTLFAWGMTMLFPNQFVMIFNKDAELLPLTVKSMHIYFFGFFFMAFQFTGQTTFQALGKSKQAIFFSMLRKVIIVVPLTFLLPMIPEIGVTGVFLAEPISNLIGGLACFITMYVTVYRKLEV